MKLKRLFYEALDNHKLYDETESSFVNRIKTVIVSLSNKKEIKDSVQLL